MTETVKLFEMNWHTGIFYMHPYLWTLFSALTTFGGLKLCSYFKKRSISRKIYKDSILPGKWSKFYISLKHSKNNASFQLALIDAFFNTVRAEDTIPVAGVDEIFKSVCNSNHGILSIKIRNYISFG